MTQEEKILVEMFEQISDDLDSIGYKSELI